MNLDEFTEFKEEEIDEEPIGVCFEDYAQNHIVHKHPILQEFRAMTTMDYSHDGEYLITAHNSGCVQLREGLTGEVLHTWKAPHAGAPSATSACFHPGALGALVSNEKGCMRWYRCNEEGPEVDTFIDEVYEISAVDFSPGGDSVAVASRCQRVRLYDIETKKVKVLFKNREDKLAARFAKRFHAGRIVSICCHPDNPNIIASGGWDSTVRIWDVRRPRGCAMTFQGPNICADSIDLCGDQLLAGAWDSKDGLTVWDLKSGQKSKTVIFQRDTVADGDFYYTAKFWKCPRLNEDGRYAMVGGSGTKALEVVDLIEDRLLFSWDFRGTVFCVASRENKIAWGGDECSLHHTELVLPKPVIVINVVQDEEENVEDQSDGGD